MIEKLFQKLFSLVTFLRPNLVRFDSNSLSPNNINVRNIKIIISTIQAKKMLELKECQCQETLIADNTIRY